MEYSEGNEYNSFSKRELSTKISKKKKNLVNEDLNNLLKKEKLFEQNFIDHVNWLDKITFSRLEVMKHEVLIFFKYFFNIKAKIMENALYLTIEMPSIFYNDDTLPYVIMFSADDDEYLFNNMANSTISSTIRSLNLTVSPPQGGGNYWTDPELGLENLCEIKHHMLTRNVRANDIDKRLQPNPTIRDALDAIIKVFNF